MSTIDFFCAIEKNGYEYASFLKHTAECNSSGKHDIRFKCILDRCECPIGWTKVEDAPQIAWENMKHAKAMNTVVNMSSSEYLVISDVDVAVLYKNWDDMMINELCSVDIVGAAYGKEFAKSQKRFTSFPSLLFFMSKGKILRDAQVDFSPKSLTNNNNLVQQHLAPILIDASNCDAYQLPTGSYIQADTGWSLPLAFYKAGLKSKTFFGELVNESWASWYTTINFCENIPFVTHRALSRYLPFSSPESVEWIKWAKHLGNITGNELPVMGDYVKAPKKMPDLPESVDDYLKMITPVSLPTKTVIAKRVNQTSKFRLRRRKR